MAGHRMRPRRVRRLAHIVWGDARRFPDEPDRALAALTAADREDLQGALDEYVLDPPLVAMAAHFGLEAAT